MMPCWGNFGRGPHRASWVAKTALHNFFRPETRLSEPETVARKTLTPTLSHGEREKDGGPLRGMRVGLGCVMAVKWGRRRRWIR